MENQRLQQLQDSQDITEEGDVVLLPDLMHVQMDAAMQESSNHRQVSENTHHLIKTQKTRTDIYLTFFNKRT